MKKRKKWWNFRAQENGTAELMIYGIIDSISWWGDEITPQDFKADLDALGDITSLNIYINSDGGDVFAGQAIHSIIKRHKAQTTVYVDGLAASIASVIAMAGDTIVMPRNAMMMIHNPWTIGLGNAQDFRKLADDLDNIRESIIAAYQEKSGMDQEKLIELLDAETWLTADEAKAYGLADVVEEDKAVAASAQAGILVMNGQEMDLSKFKNPPKLIFPAENKTKTPPEDRPKRPISLYEKRLKINEYGGMSK